MLGAPTLSAKACHVLGLGEECQGNIGENHVKMNGHEWIRGLTNHYFTFLKRVLLGTPTISPKEW
jgi:hypothetical protein